MYEATDLEAEIHLQIETEKEKGVLLRFSSSVQPAIDAFPNQKIQKTADILGIQIQKTVSPAWVDICIPYTSDRIDLLAEDV
jgi:hypothetical protein